jgi:hypothetical protein
LTDDPRFCPAKCPNLVVAGGWRECAAYRKQLSEAAGGGHDRLAECVAEERAGGAPPLSGEGGL